MNQEAGSLPPPNTDDQHGLGGPDETSPSIPPPDQPRVEAVPPDEPSASPTGAVTPGVGAATRTAWRSAPKGPLPVHHIGVAVRSIDQAMHFYGDTMGLSLVDRRHLADRQLDVAFVQAGNLLIELLEPTSEDTTVARFLDRRGPGLHHLCFGTTDIDEHLRDLKDKGVLLIDEMARPGAHGEVAFLDPAAAHGVLVELIQPSEILGGASG